MSYSNVPVKHRPFYELTDYLDKLDLKHVGFDLQKFTKLFDFLDDARTSQAIAVNRLLHLPSGTEMVRGGNAIWKPRRARELELRMLEVLHRFGLSVVPATIRRILGKAFDGFEMTAFDVDLIDVFYWAALARVAREYAWQDERLSAWCDYLEYPVRRVFGAAAISYDE